MDAIDQAARTPQRAECKSKYKRIRGRRLRASGLLLILAANAGCNWNTPVPSARTDRPKQADEPEPPQVVKAETPLPAAADPVTNQIESYIQRIDAADRRRDAGSKTGHEAGRPPQSSGDTGEAAPSRDAGAVSLSGDDARRPDGIPGAPKHGEESIHLLPAAADTAPADETSAPPRLDHVEVRAAGDGPVTMMNSDLSAPNAALSTIAGPTSLREFLEQLPPATDDDAFGQQLDRRMLAAVAGQYEAAREPLRLVTDEQQQLARALIESVIAIREGKESDLSAAATSALKRIAELRESLSRVAELSVPTVALCRAVRGFGQYDALEPAKFVTGVEAEMVLYCEVHDFASARQADGSFVTRFDMTTSILTARGDSVLELSDPDLVDRCRARRSDCFIPRLVRLPATLAPGDYVAKVTVRDKLGNKAAEGRTTFSIVTRR